MNTAAGFTLDIRPTWVLIVGKMLPLLDRKGLQERNHWEHDKHGHPKDLWQIAIQIQKTIGMSQQCLPGENQLCHRDLDDTTAESKLKLMDFGIFCSNIDTLTRWSGKNPVILAIQKADDLKIISKQNLGDTCGFLAAKTIFEYKIGDNNKLFRPDFCGIT